MNTEDLAKKLRMHVIEMSHRAKAAHLGSALSTIDILSVLYSSFLQIYDLDNKKYEDRDRFILSKGHAATALYATLAYFGIIDKEELLYYGKKGSLLEEHPSTKLAGVEASTGSLGHGLPIANGISLSAKILSKKFKALIILIGLDLFFPTIFSFGPWSGVILRKGKPIVIFIASNSNNVLIGASTWSWYIPIITLNFFLVLQEIYLNLS